MIPCSVALPFLLVLAFHYSQAQSFTTRLLAANEIAGFPSSSAIVCHGRNLYVIGDDSRNLLVLDLNYTRRDSVLLFQGSSFRIARKDKADLESAFMAPGFRKQIILMGSGASPKRQTILVTTLNRNNRKGQVRNLNASAFFGKISSMISPVNMEAAALIGRNVVLGNRKSQKSDNRIVVADLRSVLNYTGAEFREIRLRVPDTLSAIGVSDFSYVRSRDMLIVTFSSEDSVNPLEDGTIGDSYFAVITDVKKKIRSSEIKIEDIINLSSHRELAGHKVEGVCVEKAGGRDLILHLVSDDDDGRSHVFKMQLEFKKN
jgi:hypothetical protein